MAYSTASVDIPIPIIEPVVEYSKLGCAEEELVEKPLLVAVGDVPGGVLRSREARPTESSSFDGQWRISQSAFLSKDLEIPTLPQVLQQLPVRTARIRAAPNLQRYPLLQSQADAFLGSFDRERSAIMRSSHLRCCLPGKVAAEEEAEGPPRSRLRPDLRLSSDPRKRLLWQSEAARSYGGARQLPCHLPAAYYPTCRHFSSSGYAGKRRNASLSTAIERSRIHKSLERLGGA
ncbi:hypothetical protein Efla_002579 [Eimeria flavescens]